MKVKTFKPLLLALTLPFITGCQIVDNIIDNIALTVAFSTDLIVNKVGMDGQVPFTEKPISDAKRASLTYGLEALAIPKSIELPQLQNRKIDFALTFSKEDLFFVTELAPETEEADIEIYTLVPLGSSAKPAPGTSVEDFFDTMDFDKLRELKNLDDEPLEITVTGTAGTKVKSKKFYFNLNADGIKIPGGGVEIVEEFAVIVEETNTPVTKDIIIPRAELTTGFTFNLQAAWGKYEPNATGTGEVTIDITSILDDYDLILPVTNKYDVVLNETLVDYPVTITLKSGHTLPVGDFTLTFSLVVVPDVTPA